MSKTYKVVQKRPAAKFFYKGSHTHPVRRTVLVIEDKPEVLVGYEIREGKTLRPMQKAKIKSYRKDRIAQGGDYCRLPKDAGLKRMSLLGLLKTGV